MLTQKHLCAATQVLLTDDHALPAVMVEGTPVVTCSDLLQAEAAMDMDRCDPGDGATFKFPPYVVRDT